MDTFDTKRRDHPSMDKHMDPKAPPFGGPNETAPFNGKKRKTLDKYQRVIERDRNFEGNLHDPATGEEMSQPNYDSSWKAISRDKISRDAHKKPIDVMYAKNTAFTKAIEEGKIFRFEEFVKVNEELDMNTGPIPGTENEAEDPLTQEPEGEENTGLGYEVDEEQLQTLMDEHGDELTELIDKLAEEMELEKDAICDLLCAAIEKICKPEDDEESTESSPDEETTEPGGSTEEPQMP